jgi:hypothetical protein
VGEDHVPAGDRLGEEQLHRPPVDLAGDGPGPAANRPDADDGLHQRVRGDDGQGVLRVEELHVLAAEERL